MAPSLFLLGEGGQNKKRQNHSKTKGAHSVVWGRNHRATPSKLYESSVTGLLIQIHSESLQSKTKSKRGQSKRNENSGQQRGECEHRGFQTFGRDSGHCPLAESKQSIPDPDGRGRSRRTGIGRQRAMDSGTNSEGKRMHCEAVVVWCCSPSTEKRAVPPSVARAVRQLAVTSFFVMSSNI